MRKIYKRKFRISTKYLPKITKRLPYPLLMAYSDIFTVSGEAFDNFAHLCGIFSSMRMFAEIAVPTALAMASKKLVLLQETDFTAKTFWSFSRGVELENLKQESRGNVNNLFLNERQNNLYYHPIKLSSWEV